MKFWESIHWTALRDVFFYKKGLDGSDPLYELRKIFRWYSETFATPLHQVDDLPLEDVLRAGNEHTFEAMSDEELDQLVRETAISPERMAEMDRAEDREEVEMRDLAAEAVAQNAQHAVASKKLEDVVMPVQNALQNLLKQVRATGKETELVSGPAPKLLKDGMPPEIKMVFMNEDELEAELDRDSLGLFEDPKRRRR